MIKENVYSTVDDLWVSTLSELLSYEHVVKSRAGTTKEIFGYQATLSNVDRTFLLNPRRKLSPYYGCAEVLWYLSWTYDITMIRAYAPQYVDFAEGDEAYGAYGARFTDNLLGRDGEDFVRHYADCNQLKLAVEVLKRRPDSRQCVVTCWEANDLVHAYKHDHKDMPCTLALNFLVRTGCLHLVATMRSNDAWLGLPYDVFAFTCIQRIIASALGLKCGAYVHQSASEHLYEKDWEKAREAVERARAFETNWRTAHEWEDVSRLCVWDDASQAVEVERCWRTNLWTDRSVVMNKLYNEVPVLRDLVACCCAKWTSEWASEVKSPVLKEAIENVNS